MSSPNHNNLTQISFLFLHSEPGECCYSARAATGDGKDETLSAEPFNTDNTFQTNKVSVSLHNTYFSATQNKCQTSLHYCAGMLSFDHVTV